MSTKRPSIVVLSDLIQKYVGSDFDTIKYVADHLEELLATTGLTLAVDYTVEGFPQETLGELLQAYAVIIKANEVGVNTLNDINNTISELDLAILGLLAQFNLLLQRVVSSKAYIGGYDAAGNIPNLTTPLLGEILQGYSYDVTIAGSAFFGQPLQIGDSIRATTDNPDVFGDWVVIANTLNAVSIKIQYESNANTNAFTNAYKLQLDTPIEAVNTVFDPTGTDFVATDVQALGAEISTRVIGLDIDVVDGSLYSQDPLRGKLLSVAEITYLFQKRNDSDNNYLTIGDINYTEQGYRPLRDCTIVGIVAEGRNNLTKEFQLEVEATTPLNFNLVAGKYSSTLLDIDVDAGENIRMFIPSTGADVRDPSAVLYVKWRK